MAAFSDDIRDGVKGAVWDKKRAGFINGRPGLEETIKFSVVAATKHPQVDYSRVDYSKAPWAAEPHHCVSYVSCHDNHTLWDKLGLAGEKPVGEAERVRLQKFANAIVLTSQGIAFLHAGEEFCRTKHGEENSYNLGDRINALDWRRKKNFRAVFNYYRGLIALRRGEPAFRLTSAAEIRRRLAFLPAGEGIVAFLIDAPRQIVVIYNARRESAAVNIPEGRWSVLVDANQAGTQPLREIAGGKIVVAPQSVLVAKSRS